MISRLMLFVNQLSRTAGCVEFVSDSDFYPTEFSFLGECEQESVVEDLFLKFKGLKILLNSVDQLLQRLIKFFKYLASKIISELE